MSRIKISDLDVIFISFDEPNAEYHWGLLLDKIPWASRVHGIKGFDKVHKTAAEQSTTEWFVTIDADCIVHDKFWDEIVEINDDEICSYYWKARNMISGVISGNGGPKLWNRNFVRLMRTHEIAFSDKTALDFVGLSNYIPMNLCYAESWQNGSPYQAWRSGYREGVKLSSTLGRKIQSYEYNHRVENIHKHRILLYCSVGIEVENGIWSILGARQGCYNALFTECDIKQISDYYWFDQMWEKQISTKYITEDDVINECNKLGELLSRSLKFDFPILEKKVSSWIKKVMELGK